MNKVIEIFLGAVIIWIVEYLAGKILLPNNKKTPVLKSIITILLFSIALSIVNIVNFEIYYGVLKILCNYLLQMLFFKFLFNISFSKSMVIALVWYLTICLSEVIIAIPLSVFSKLFSFNLSVVKNTVAINIAIPIITYFIVLLLRKNLRKVINNDKFSQVSKILMVIVILVTLALLGFRLPVTKWAFDTEFIITMIILFLFCVVGIFVIKQNSDIQKTSARYQEVVKYSNTTNKLLEDYRMVNHEHKNQLSVIRQMIDKNNTELFEYIDSLIEKHNDIKYKWVADLNNIPDKGLRGLINYKLIEAEEKSINITVIISKEVSKIKLNKMNTKEKDELYSIIGVYLDNSIQAAKESKDKEINLEIYKDKKDIVFILGNSYKGNIDIKRIDNYGYSTKGKNHGIGLHIVKNILSENSLFSQAREILDNFYIQHLVLHTANIKENKNKTTMW